MDNWYKLLKNALTLDIPEDQVTHVKKYGKIRSNLKYLYPSVLLFWKEGAFAYSLLLVSSLISIPGPMINRYLIDNVILNKKFALLLPILFLIVSIALINQVSAKLQGFYSSRFNQKVLLDIQERLLNRVFALPKTFFDKIHRGYLISRLTSDVQGVKWFFSSTIVQLFSQAVRFIGGVFFLFYLEWRFAIAIVIFLPVPLLITKYFAQKNYIMSHQGSERKASYSSVFQEVISAVSLIKSFSNEKLAINKITEEIKKNNQLTNEQYMLTALNGVLQNLLPQLAGFVVLGFGAYWIMTGRWTLGSLLAFQSYIGYVYGPIREFASAANQLQNSRAALQRTAALFESIPEPNVESGIEVKKLSGLVEFKDVDFAYDSRNRVFSKISFKTNPGENWAIIGESGIGKTTLISLIMRLYIPNSGKIFFDDIPVSKINIRSLRNKIGYVAQSTMLLSGSILDNLKYGNADASFEDVVNAARVADIHSFIESLPEKYSTILDEEAINLSEGQKQRLSIARALVKNPDILIFDEPTAALDNKTEYSIYQHLPDVVNGKTTFTIAHRLGTIKNADKIIMLRGDNKLPFIGTHKELFDSEIEYRLFFEEPYN